MPDLIQTNFTAGELSPLIAGLVDQAKYYNGLEICENFLVHPQGGLYRRGGTRYVAATKNNAKVRLIPFIFNASQAYILEFGANYIRFFADGGQVMKTGSPYEIASPWNATQVWELEFAQSNDVLYLARRGSQLKKLVRLDHDHWYIGTVDFVHPPTTTLSWYPDSTLTPGAVTGDAVTFTMSLFSTTGDTTDTSAIITNVGDTSGFTVGDWVTISAGFPAGEHEILGKTVDTLTMDANATSTESGVTVQALGFLPGDKGRSLYYPSEGARARIVEHVSSSQVKADILDDFPSTDPIASGSWYVKGLSDSTVTKKSWRGNDAGYGISAIYMPGEDFDLTADVNAFRKTDVGKYLPLWGGVLQAQTYVSPVKMTVSVIKELSARPNSTKQGDMQEARYWSFQEPAWTDAKGWPGAVCFFEGRIVCAGTDSFPQTIWASAVANYEDFCLGANDADAWAFTLAGDQLNSILWILPLKSLMVGTTDAEWLLGGGNNPISATNPPVARSETGHGCAQTKPLNLSSHALFLQRGGYKLRDMVYRFESDSHISNDLMLLSSHLTAQYGMVQLASSKEPQQTIWAIRSDGALLSLTYQREQDVVAWTRHLTDGDFESVAVIPGTLQDEVWLTVERTIGGATKRYVEILNWFDEGDDLEDAYFVDSGLSYSGAPATIITGLDHLEGESVAILADGAVHPNKTVASGQITLNWSASVVHAGLPMTSQARTMRPEIPGGKVTTFQMVRRRVIEVLLRLNRTRGGKIGPDASTLDWLLYRKPEHKMDELELYTGDIITNPRSGHDLYGQLQIVCDQPLPFSLMLLAKRLGAGVA